MRTQWRMTFSSWMYRQRKCELDMIVVWEGRRAKYGQKRWMTTIRGVLITISRVRSKDLITKHRSRTPIIGAVRHHPCKMLHVCLKTSCSLALPSYRIEMHKLFWFEATFYIVASISCNSGNEDTFPNYETSVSIRIQDHLTKGQECVPLELMISQKRSRNC